MSSRQRKRRGGAVESGEARKRSRLLPPSAGETSQTELTDLEGSATLSSEPAEEVTDFPGEPAVAEVIVTIDDESDVDSEPSQQQQHFSSASENSDGQQASDTEEDSGDDDCKWTANLISPPTWEEEDSEDREQSQQYLLSSRSEENSDVQWASDNEEEPGDDDGSLNSSEWPDRFESPPTSQDDITDDGEESQQYPLGSSSEDNSPQLPSFRYYLEPRDIEFEPSGALVNPPTWENEDSELRQVYEQQRRNVTRNSPEQVDGSGNGAGASNAPVADAAPAEEGAAQEDTARSDGQQGVVIRCPICMDVYSEIIQHGRQLVATLCGHVFCSRCLPVALETSGMCPTCRMDLTPELYIPIYL